MGISIGLVGLGSFGRAFADLFMSHPLVDRVGLCDREPERITLFANKESWQAKFNPRDVYTSLDDICRSDLDANLALRNHLNSAKQSMINSLKQSESLAH